MNDPYPTLPEARWLRWSIAFVWLATGLAVFHPAYRETGAHYLAKLDLPDWVMFATCAVEVLLGLRVALGSAATWLTVLQGGMIVTFTIILAWLEPRMLVNPFGMLSKNLPLLAAIGAAWLVEREGWSRRVLWLLRIGVAVIWITEGVFPKILFPEAAELQLVRHSRLVLTSAETFLPLLGLAEALSGVAALVLRGWPYRLLLACQAAALIVLPLLVSFQDPLLWVHPFGPLIKNVPILAGTLVLLRRWR